MEYALDGPLYCGYWHDTETGLSQTQNRYYNPNLSTSIKGWRPCRRIRCRPPSAGWHWTKEHEIGCHWLCQCSVRAEPSVFFVGRSSDGGGVALDERERIGRRGGTGQKSVNAGATGFASAACVLTFGVFVGRSSDDTSKSDAPPLQRLHIPNGASAKRPQPSKKARRGGTGQKSMHSVPAGFASAAAARVDLRCFCRVRAATHPPLEKRCTALAEGCIPNGASTKRAHLEEVARVPPLAPPAASWPRMRGPA